MLLWAGYKVLALIGSTAKWIALKDEIWIRVD